MTQQQQLSELLQQEIQLLDRLMQSLEREYDSLQQRDPEVLEPAVKEKQRDVIALEKVSRERKSLLDTMLGGDSSKLDVAGVLKEDNQLTRLWTQLTSKALQCKDRNRMNGAVVEALSRTVGQALDVIQGKQEATAAAGINDQSGHAVAGAVKHSLTQV